MKTSKKIIFQPENGAQFALFACAHAHEFFARKKNILKTYADFVKMNFGLKFLNEGAYFSVFHFEFPNFFLVVYNYYCLWDISELIPLKCIVGFNLARKFPIKRMRNY